jgi:hypothetical protein
LDNPIIIGQLSAAALLLALITVWLNHLLANTRDSKNKRADQGSKVIDAFRPELDALIQSPESKDARSILTDYAYKRHEAAIRNFLPHLAWIPRIRMCSAWRKLAHHKEDPKKQIPGYVQYADFGSLTARRNIRPIVIKRIQNIISIAS